MSEKDTKLLNCFLKQYGFTVRNNKNRFTLLVSNYDIRLYNKLRRFGVRPYDSITVTDMGIEITYYCFETLYVLLVHKTKTELLQDYKDCIEDLQLERIHLKEKEQEIERLRKENEQLQRNIKRCREEIFY